MRTHLILIGLVTLVVALFYARLSGAWFCGYDDFNEAHRAAFSNSQDPKRLFTTTHDLGYMYRPLTSALQYLTWNAFEHNPLAFRLRNLAMHLVALGTLYGIVLLLTDSTAIAIGASLLFGLSPMVNETVVVGIWTNSTAYAIAFTAFFLFLYSLRLLQAGRGWRIPLTAALLCAFVALFTYEPTISIFFLIIAYLAVWRSRGFLLPSAYVTFLLTGIAVEMLLFFGIRHLVITSSAPVNSLDVIIRNAAMYFAALVLPIDVVLANAVFGTPLPSDMHFGLKLLALPLIGGVSLLVLMFVLARSPRTNARLSTLDWPLMAFLGAGILLGVLPLLLFREHPSEHDLYLSAGLYAAALGILARRLTRSKAAFAVVVLALAASYAAGISIRNQRVEQCAAIAHRILSQLPTERWRKGEWHIRLATTPLERLGKPYAIYNDFGLHALETENGSTPGAQYAIQIAASNERIKVNVEWQSAQMTHCTQTDTCFWVSPAGSVRSAVPIVTDRAVR